ncbi:MAG: CrcB family protein [Acidimicrobiales bacterium]|jgi:CrcB protein|nr:CrcB family protein [Acidimicrobiales bacterium]MDG1876767.1 CrcB family protein [Acidimicrobiales bacterium]
MTPVLFVIAAAAGTFVRWQTWRASTVRPAATLAVNVVGAFLLGMLTDASDGSEVVGGVAGMGALTTFSTLIAEMVDMWSAGRRVHAASYGALTFALGVGAAWLGIALA